MIPFEKLPLLNAILNSITTCFLLTGLVQIKKRNIPAHRACMSAALVTSAIFLTSYLIYHYTAGVTRFRGTGALRVTYLSILTSHTILAVFVLPLALTTLYRALRGQFEIHRKVARWTFPVWLYVSVTGVVIYVMLNHVVPPAQ
jgi:putative membrane protein